MTKTPYNGPPQRDWDVLLIGGASGTGKTSVSYALAHRFGVGITEVDDLYIAVEQLTTPAQQPLLHYWQTNPHAVHMTAQEIMDLHIAVCRLLAPAILAVIANHLETDTPIVLEGDYLLPELFVAPEAPFMRTGQVKGVFLFEADEAQIQRNYAAREPDAGDQAGRARVSWLFGRWLQDACLHAGLSALPARPWHTLEDRIMDRARH